MQDKKVEKYISDQFLMHSIVAIILSYVVVHFGMKEGFFFAARFAFVIFILSYLIWQVFKKYIYRTDHWHLNAMIFHRKAAIIKNKKKKKREYDKYPLLAEVFTLAVERLKRSTARAIEKLNYSNHERSVKKILDSSLFHSRNARYGSMDICLF